ncbi:hypothetical protein CPC08DRAFT_767764 [Agrocybe pediades]|nr:hypothetical protein CPC08DRAFT_767764 [Agrocybe pediades]
MAPEALEGARYPSVDIRRWSQNKIPQTDDCSNELRTRRLASALGGAARELMDVRQQVERLKGCWKVLRRSMDALLGKDAVWESHQVKQGGSSTSRGLQKRLLLEEMDADELRPRSKRRHIEPSSIPYRRPTQVRLTHGLFETSLDLECVNPFTPSQSSPISLRSPTTDYAAPDIKTLSKNKITHRSPPHPKGHTRFDRDKGILRFNPVTGKAELVRDLATLDAEARRSVSLEDTPITAILLKFGQIVDTAYEFVVLEDYFEVPISPDNNIVPVHSPFPDEVSSRDRQSPENDDSPSGSNVPVDEDGRIDLALYLGWS